MPGKTWILTVTTKNALKANGLTSDRGLFKIKKPLSTLQRKKKKKKVGNGEQRSQKGKNPQRKETRKRIHTGMKSFRKEKDHSCSEGFFKCLVF